MTPFFHAARTRYIATAMLFVWLMALSLGVAKACLITEGSDQHGLAMHSEHAATKTSERDSSAAADDACVKFCKAEQATVVKVKHAGGESSGTDSAPVLIVSGELVWSVDRVPQAPSQGVPRWLEPRVSIRFLRLTI